VGFNAIYHVTDLASFVSGETLALFDPMARHLPATSAANPGKRVNFVAHDITQELADQVAPLCLFGCDMRQPFAGTLFRWVQSVKCMR
jgi:sacsin